MKHLSDTETFKLVIELAPFKLSLGKAKSVLKNSTSCDMRDEAKRDIRNIRDRIRNVEARHGIFMHYSCICNPDMNTPLDDGERREWSIHGALGDIPVPGRLIDEGADEIDYWLKQIGAIRENVKCDHYGGGSNYYFSSRKSAESFCDKINKKLHMLQKKHYI